MRGHREQVTKEYMSTVARGSSVGAMIGSVIPGIGSVLGGIIGGKLLTRQVFGKTLELGSLFLKYHNSNFGMFRHLKG